jgi:CPA1 family monovalent cation:H+ antiporter
MISTFVTGTALWLILGLAGWHVKFIYALLFGAIISPTDPIATLAILKSAGLPKRLETLINGESLFNDGVAVVLFTVIGGIAFGGHQPAFREVSFLLGQEVLAARCSDCSWA